MNQSLATWLESIGLGEYSAVFARNDIDLDVLRDLTDQDLRELGLSLGHRRRFLKAVARGIGVEGDGRADQAERRHLTVMFCDLVGSTALSTRFDPEELREIVRAFQNCCERVVDAFGGYVARYMGDGLLVYFGYPVANELDPERAVRAGLEVVQSVSQLKFESTHALQTRVGVATGPVVVGDWIGEGTAKEHAAIGETPNLARRLQQLAEPDSVVISDTTKQLVGNLFEFEHLGEHTPKGFDKAITVWAVGDELLVESRFKAIHASFRLTEMVGRDAEVNALLDCYRLASTGKGQAILISGEAGIGKSRLAYALCEQLKDTPHVLKSYFCVPYHERSTLYPMIDQLERAAKFAREDKGDAKLKKLETLIKTTSTDVKEVVPLVASVLSIPISEDYSPLDLSPARQKEKTLKAFERMILGTGKAGAPAVIVFEDLHWIDPTTLELIHQVIERLENLPLFLILTGRSGELDQSLLDTDRIRSVKLDRLPQDEIERLVTDVAGDLPIPATTLDQIIEKSDGVPFFVEELAKTVIDKSLADQAGQRREGGNLELPNTLKQSLAARIDKLGSAKALLQLCATLGQEFEYRLLRAVWGLKNEGELQTQLGFIVASGFLSQTGVPPRSRYAFAHALIQETAYESLLRSTRLKRHRQIAEILQDGFPEIAVLRPEELAHHYENAGDWLRSVNYWLAACNKALDSYANLEAVRLAERGLAALRASASADTDGDELRLRAKLARALLATKGYSAPEVSENFGIARDLCKRIGDPPETFQIQVGMWMFYVISGQWNAGRDVAKKLTEIAGRNRDPAQLLQAQYCLGFTLYHRADFDEAEKELRLALASEEYGVDYSTQSASGDDTRVHLRMMLSLVSLQLGRVSTAAEFVERALDMATALKHPYGNAFVSSMASWLYQMERQPKLALEHSGRAIHIAKEKGFRYWIPLATFIHSWAEARKNSRANQPSDCDGMVSALETYLAMGAGGGQTLLSASLAEELIRSGDFESAKRWLTRARSAAEDTGELLYEPEVTRLEALLWLSEKSASVSVIEKKLRDSLAHCTAKNSKLLALRIATDLAGLLKESGRTVEACELLTDTYRSMPEDSDLPDWEFAKSLLRQLE